MESRDFSIEVCRFPTKVVDGKDNEAGWNDTLHWKEHLDKPYFLNEQ